MIINLGDGIAVTAMRLAACAIRLKNAPVGIGMFGLSQERSVGPKLKLILSNY